MTLIAFVPISNPLLDAWFAERFGLCTRITSLLVLLLRANPGQSVLIDLIPFKELFSVWASIKTLFISHVILEDYVSSFVYGIVQDERKFWIK